MSERHSPTEVPSAAALRRRRQRVDAGHRARQAETAALPGRPSQGQLLLPLLDLLAERGGSARPAEIYEELADRLNVPNDVRNEEAEFAGKVHNLWQRSVRHARQLAKLRGYVASPERGVWELIQGGRNALRNVRAGVVITVFETDAGICLGANVEAAAGLLEPGSVDLLFSSPPFPLLSGKEYGTSGTAEWLRWMTGLCREWHELLAPTGSMVFELNDVHHRGMPVQSQYIERLGIWLEDELGMFKPGRLLWENPNRKGALAWCGLRLVRLNPTAAPLLWMAKGPHPRADVRPLKVPYTDRTREQLVGVTGQRSTGLRYAAGVPEDRGGAIPSNIIRCGNAGNDAYARACKAAGLKPHPARLPAKVASTVIKYLTAPGDLVVDPFFGSGTIGAEAEKLGRRWVGLDRALRYLEGAQVRFKNAPGFRSHV